MRKKKPAKKRPYNANATIRAALRRVFTRSPAVQETLRKARREIPSYKKDGTLSKRPRVQYRCSLCSEWFPRTQIQVDHEDPVIGPEGFVDWNLFVEKLFCEADNLNCLCKSCHQSKTNEESRARRERKKSLSAK